VSRSKKAKEEKAYHENIKAFRAALERLSILCPLMFIIARDVT